MKSILVPTDFSKSAHNAYLYARDLAASIGAQLNVMHAHHPHLADLDKNNMPSDQELMEYKRTQLESFINDALPKSTEGIIEKKAINKEVIIGFPKEEIIKYSDQKEIAMILMSTTGSGSVMDKLFGSVSSEVSLKAHCPVWLVPPNTKFNGIKNILYAGNYESADGRMLREISGLANLFQANVHLVHVSKKKSFEENKIQELVLERLFNKKAPTLDFKMETVVSEKIWEGLDYYASENDIDLTVIVTKHRSFWENIRHSSITKKLVFHTKTPLLIMHLDDVLTDKNQ